MQSKHLFRPWAAALAILFLLLLQATWMAAQPQASRPASKAPAAAAPSPGDEEIAATRARLFELLRLSPRLTTVLGRDPSLLADQEYVSRNNPELAQFLQQHPEIIRNPEFYLFSQGGSGAHLESYVFPERRPHLWDSVFRDVMPFFVLVVFLIAILWLLRVLLENRRWGKTLKLQSDLHNKLLDKFGNTQDLLTYMSSEAGKRLLEATPLPASELPSPGRLSLERILLPLQIGIVVLLVGMGSFALQGVPGGEIGFRVLGMLGVMLGVGFIISAALSFLMARHLGLLPQNLKKTAVLGEEKL